MELLSGTKIEANVGVLGMIYLYTSSNCFHHMNQSKAYKKFMI